VLFGSFFGGDQNIYPTALVLDAAAEHLSGWLHHWGPAARQCASGTAGGGYNEALLRQDFRSPKPVGAANIRVGRPALWRERGRSGVDRVRLWNGPGYWNRFGLNPTAANHRGWEPASVSSTPEASLRQPRCLRLALQVNFQIPSGVPSAALRSPSFRGWDRRRREPSPRRGRSRPVPSQQPNGAHRR